MTPNLPRPNIRLIDIIAAMDDLAEGENVTMLVMPVMLNN